MEEKIFGGYQNGNSDNGSGRKIVSEAAARGIEVTAFVSKAAELNGAKKIIIKDILDSTADDLKKFGAVVDAFGA